MGQYHTPPDMNDVIKDLKARIQALENTTSLRVYTLATRPTNPGTGHPIVFVSDAAAGSKFQGWDGASWVSLG